MPLFRLCTCHFRLCTLCPYSVCAHAHVSSASPIVPLFRLCTFALRGGGGLGRAVAETRAAAKRPGGRARDDQHAARGGWGARSLISVVGVICRGVLVCHHTLLPCKPKAAGLHLSDLRGGQTPDRPTRIARRDFMHSQHACMCVCGCVSVYCRCTCWHRCRCRCRCRC